MMAVEHPGDAGPAVLELGQEVGAAVIYTAAALDLAEIEIRPDDRNWNGEHTAVRKRPGRPPVYAALFFALRQGRYQVRVRGTGPALNVQVTGGRVTEVCMSGWERAAGEADTGNSAP
jgi:hypothetical protein